MARNTWMNMIRKVQEGSDRNKRLRAFSAMKAAKLDPKNITAIRKVADDMDKKGFKSAAIELRKRAKSIEQGFR